MNSKKTTSKKLESSSPPQTINTMISTATEGEELKNDKKPIDKKQIDIAMQILQEHRKREDV